jgi:hypothetical protein
MGGDEVGINYGWGVSGMLERSSSSSNLRSTTTAPFSAKENEIGLITREPGIREDPGGEDPGIKARRLARRKSVS